MKYTVSFDKQKREVTLSSKDQKLTISLFDFIDILRYVQEFYGIGEVWFTSQEKFEYEKNKNEGFCKA